jgi:hypothetical protein
LADEPKCDDTLANIESCPCLSEGAQRSCYTGPAGSSGKGTCHDGKQTCAVSGEFLLWGPCTGDVTPHDEVCSQTNDENCNGLTGCADPVCTGIAGCCQPSTTRACYDGPTGTEGVGACHGGTQTCDAGGAWLGCTGEVVPSGEAGHCNDGVDNDCNGKTDCDDPACAADIACKPPICAANTTKSCYDGPAGTQGVGVCHAGTQTCAPDGQSWSSTCAGEVVPGSEAGHCGDGVDNDCDGMSDCLDPDCNGDPKCACTPGAIRNCYAGPVGTEGVGVCHAGTQVCNNVGSAWGPCNGAVYPSVEAGACTDGLDNDCDGLTDCEDTSCTFEAACCVPTTTYDTTIFATSATTLWIINPSDWSETAVGTYGATENMTDIAMTPNGELYTVSSTSLYHVDRTTAKATKVVTLTGSLNNALTFLPDNRLLAADASGTLKVIDPVAKTVTNIGSYGNGLGSSGDLVAVGDGTLFGISQKKVGGADSSTDNLLITVDPSTGAATPVGYIGYGNVFGLAYYGSRVIAFTQYSGGGQILEINPVTGFATLLGTHNHAYYGGTTSPLIPINGCM